MAIPDGFALVRKEWLPIISEIDRRAAKQDGRNYDFTVVVTADEYRAADDADRSVVPAAFRPSSNDEEIDTLRARVAELERALDSASKGPENYRSGLSDGKRIARQQCAAIMAVCGYFSRMRGPDFWYIPAEGEDDEDALVLPTRTGACPSSYATQRAFPLYAGSAPVPAAQAEAKVADETPESVIAAYKAGLTHGREQPDYEFEFASGSASDTAYAIGYNEGYEQRLASATVPQAEAKVATANEVLSLVRQYGNRCFIEGNHIGAGIGDQEYDEAASKSAYEKVASTIGSKFTPAEAKVADDVLGDAIYHIAALAHLGGLKDEPADLLCAIRKLSLPWFDGSGTARDLERRVTRAMIAAKAKKGGA